eukprot:6077543-Amphidinium_carterae.1
MPCSTVFWDLSEVMEVIGAGFGDLDPRPTTGSQPCCCKEFWRPMFLSAFAFRGFVVLTGPPHPRDYYGFHIVGCWDLYSRCGYLMIRENSALKRQPSTDLQDIVTTDPWCVALVSCSS